MINRTLAAFIMIFILTTTATVVEARGRVQLSPIPQYPIEKSRLDLLSPMPLSTSQTIANRPNDATVIRQRLVNVNWNLLKRTTGSTLRLNLFDDATYNIRIERQKTDREEATGGKFHLVQFGRIIHLPDSEVYLARRGNSLSGSIRLPDGKFYQIRSLGSGIHGVREIDTTAFPADHPSDILDTLAGENKPEKFNHQPSTFLSGIEPLSPTSQQDDYNAITHPFQSYQSPPFKLSNNQEKPTQFSSIPSLNPQAINQQSTLVINSNTAHTSPALTASFTDNSILKLLVVYTANVRKATQTSDSINTLIDIAEMETNQGFINSKINRKIQIVHRQEVEYPESGNGSTDVNRLINPSDGFLDSIHILRQLYHADVVSLWVSDLDGCGRGRLMKSASLAFQDRAFHVVKYDCAMGNYSLAHELGHHLGANHDIENSQTNGVYPYSHGYQDPMGEFRTIMAYKCPHGCQRINYWSNPDQTFQGKPLGIANQSDNVRTLKNTFAIATAWDRPAFTGQCFARQVYWRGDYFPQYWIIELRSQGYLISHLAQRGQEFVVVLSKPMGQSEQTRITHLNWRKPDLITEVGTTADQWQIVLGKPVSYTQQKWIISRDFPKDWIKKNWSYHYQITTIGSKKNQWAIVMSTPTSYELQKWVISHEFPKNWVKEGWKSKRQITSVAGIDNQFAVVMSKPSDYSKQAWITADNFPDLWVGQKQKEGYQITDVSGTKKEWAVVMSTCR